MTGAARVDPHCTRFFNSLRERQNRCAKSGLCYDAVVMKKRLGRFITLEGVEGCGKTTQLAYLTDFLRDRSIPFVKTKEPGGTRIGREIRKILLNRDSTGMTSACEALLYLADRAQHHEQVVKPALESGTWIVCDRYQDSTIAYQGGARGLSAVELDRIFRLVTGNLKPDLTLLLDLDPDTGLRRARQRLDSQQMAQAEGRFEDERLEFHETVRRAFLAMAKKEPSRFAVVDADRTPEAVARAIREILEKREGLLV